MVRRAIVAILNYKIGPAFYIIAGLLFFFGIAIVTQYWNTGSVNIRSMVDTGAEMDAFWKQNPRLEFANSYSRTSLVQVRDRQTGLTSMLDLRVVTEAEVRPLPCAGFTGWPDGAAYPGAGGTVCFDVVKPDNGNGPVLSRALSFSAKAKDSQVADYYRAWFSAHGKRVEVMEDSSRAIILEADDESYDTVARVSICSSFGTAYGFVALAASFR